MDQDALPARIENLLGAMSLEEKLGQLTMIREDEAQIAQGRAGSVLDLQEPARIRKLQEIALEKTRLGIPLLFSLDVLHGYETVFPVPLAEAAAMEPALWQATARAAAIETKAAGIALTFAPMLDVARDPRWGRIVESPGEDPWLGARFGEAKVRGFQGASLGEASSVAATAKHFAAYGAVTAGRDYSSVDVSARTMHEVYLPPFAAAVRAGVAAIMPAFSDLAGVPLTAHVGLLRGLLRERYGFEGVIVSDFNAVAELISHGVAANAVEAAALALKAGVDIDMVSGAYLEGLPEALERGLVSQAEIDTAVRRVLELKARLGLFERPFADEGVVSYQDRLSAFQSPPSLCLSPQGEGEPLNFRWGEFKRPLAPWGQGQGEGGFFAGRRDGQAEAVSPGLIRSHRALAREAARKSAVLLQNRGGILPLAAPAGRAVVAGPFADAAAEMLGPWRAAGKGGDVSYLQGLRGALPGWEFADFADFASAEAKKAAAKADVLLLCLGETSAMSGEATSRARPGLPGTQAQLFEDALAFGKPVIVVLTCGRPLIEPALFEKADAVLVTWFAGSEAGNALAGLVTGAVNPSGKLPVSWPAEIGQIPIFYAQRRTGRPADPKAEQTSKYIDAPVAPLFPFGHGLSYTRFGYGKLRVSPQILRPGEVLSIEAEIENRGQVAGEETCFLFIRDVTASVARPVLELRGVAKIALDPGQNGTVRFELGTADLAFPDDDGSPRLEPGEFEILVGPDADPARLVRKTVTVPDA